MWTYPSMNNSIEDAVSTEYGDIDSYPVDEHVSRFVEITKRYYSVFPNTSEKIVLDTIQYEKQLLCNNYAKELQLRFFGIEEENLLKDLVHTWGNKVDFFEHVRSKINSIGFYPHTHENIPDDVKNEVAKIVESGVHVYDSAPSEHECRDLYLSIGNRIKEYLLPYFTQKIHTLITTFPIQADGQIGRTEWPLIIHMRWMQIVLEDIKQQSSTARIREPFLIKEIKGRGLELVEFLRLQPTERVHIVHKAEEQQQKSQKIRDDIIWIKPTSAFTELVQVLYDADFLIDDDLKKIQPHFNFRLDPDKNRKCPADHKIKLRGTMQNILYIFRELIRQGFIQRLDLQKNAKDDYSAVFIISQHFMKENGEDFNYNSLRTTNNQLENGTKRADDSVFTKVISKFRKLG